MEGNKKQLLLQMKDGTQKRITVPADWRVTFGPLVPGSKDGNNGLSGLCLRLWSGSKSNEVQHAVFTGVESFRDMSIDIMEQVEETRQEHYRKEGDEGGEAIVAEVRVKRWVNPDEPKKNESAVQGEPGKLIKLARAV